MNTGTSEVLDCRTCGLCCRGRSGTVLLSSEDLLRWKRAGRADLEKTLVEGHFGCAGLGVDDTGACLHLHVAEGRATCAIYDLRPRVCADFEKGSDACLAFRRRGGRE